MTTDNLFQRVIDGTNFQVIQLVHPWLTCFAQNHNGHAALLIRASLPVELVVTDGQGFAVETERNGSNDYVRITSSEPGYPSLFSKLVEFILEETSRADSDAKAVKTISEAIIQFRRFASRKSGRLSEEEIRGLTAELLMLGTLSRTPADQETALRSWRGPFAGDGIGIHDFTFASGRGIEVKSTRQPAIEVRVSSAGQLVPSDGTLHLAVLPLEEVGPGTLGAICFSDLVRQSGTSQSRNAELSEIWVNALQRLGLDIDDEFYDQWWFIPGDWLCFEVTQAFPYIDPAAIPQGISKVQYSILISNLGNFAFPFEDLMVKGVQ